MLNYRFVFVSKDGEFRLGRDLTDKFSVDNPSCRFDYVCDNKDPLAVVYNSFITEENSSKTDYVVLMHADVELDIKGLIDHIESVAGKYDVIGLAGCAKFSVSQSPLNWFCGSRPFKNDRWGCVSHGELGNQTSYFSQRYPDVTDHEVACIDGLCIIMSRKAIDAGLRFDEHLGAWDFYDTDLSYSAIIEHKLKVGVIVRKDLMHYSVGKSILSKQFLETELKFRQKWKIPVPKDSPIIKEVLSGKPLPNAEPKQDQAPGENAGGRANG